MKVIKHIENAKGKTQFSFEILPPLKGQNIQTIFENIDRLMEFKPPFIDVTYHREEYTYKELPNGLLEKQVVRKRPGTVGICAAIQNKYKVDAIPHILCGGFDKEDTENFLIDLHFLKKKVEAGANYVVTQMFFDNQKYFAFVEKCRQAGIEVPIIPGLKPMATAKQLNLIPHRFHVDLPEPLIKEVIKCKDNKQVRQVGIEWCINQSKELIDFGVPFLHYYSMGKSDNIHAIAKEVF